MPKASFVPLIRALSQKSLGPSWPLLLLSLSLALPTCTSTPKASDGFVVLESNKFT